MGKTQKYLGFFKNVEPLCCPHARQKRESAKNSTLNTSSGLEHRLEQKNALSASLTFLKLQNIYLKNYFRKTCKRP